MTGMETDVAELIVYACPLGVLAEQLDAYLARALRDVGRNAAHGYMPHCTLTGFFHDDAASVPHYRATLAQALASAGSQDTTQIQIEGLHLTETFHFLKLESSWSIALIQAFADLAQSPTRRDSLRLKDWLHVSLAYQFPAERHEPLAALARAMVDPNASVAWELRLYERSTAGWVLHGQWALPSKLHARHP